LQIHESPVWRAVVFQTITGRRDYGDGSLFRSKLAQLVDHLHVVWLEAQCFTKLGRRLVPPAKLKQHGSEIIMIEIVVLEPEGPVKFRQRLVSSPSFNKLMARLP
jgi:hypothetical protein